MSSAINQIAQTTLRKVVGQHTRGNVLYHRYDGHYGLITPAE
ncbi:hypothetical protein [Kitasatospora sp. NPDC017646]